MAKVRRLDPERSWHELSLVLTDDPGIQDINERFLRLSEVTDVISFRYDPVPGEDDRFTGELVVNVQRALQCGARWSRRQGTREGLEGPSRELALYVAHGCDHLAGAEDHDPIGRKRMRRRELRWLSEMDGEDLIGDLIQVRHPPRDGACRGSHPSGT